MTTLPPSLIQYRKEATTALVNGAIRDIEFSGSTYQVLVEDPQTHEALWVFLQLDGRGGIKDAFCAAEENIECCLHLAIAYLGLFDDTDDPLHVRYQQSLWRPLFQIPHEALGDYAPDLDTTEPGHYIGRSSDQIRLFELVTRTSAAQEKIGQILAYRRPATEENSLKFSNLLPEELDQWRRGRPSAELRYELSFWSDLAKWCMRLQEAGESYTVTFSGVEQQLPNWIEINWGDWSIGLALPLEDWPKLIPGLSTVKSPLFVQAESIQGIEKLIYNSAEGSLQIVKSPIFSQPKHEGIVLKEWTYVPDKGFYPHRPHPLAEQEVLYGEALDRALTQYAPFIASLLPETPVNLTSIAPSYQLNFDADWNLHIRAFLFTLGDMTEGESRLFGDWVYVAGKGFYCLDKRPFTSAETIIPVAQVASFVTQHRAWLSEQQGFYPHVTSLEWQLGYKLSPSNRLSFQAELSQAPPGSVVQDFGAWVYIEHHGFYVKSNWPFHPFLKANWAIGAEQIPFFIHQHRDELNLIPHFFSTHNPLSELKLQVELSSEGPSIHIEPIFKLAEGYTQRNVRLFDEFTYVEGEGFYELPAAQRVPEKWRHSVDVQKEDLLSFLDKELIELTPHLSSIDIRLKKPPFCRLIVLSGEPALERGIGWYHLNLSYRTDAGVIEIHELRRALKRKFPYAFLPQGLIDLRDERYDWLRALKADRFTITGRVTINALEFIRLNATDPIEFSQEARDLLKPLVQFEIPEQPILAGLDCQLRHYQEKGVQWLWFLYRQHLSGLLCDDMGLGKTHQAMALLVAVLNFHRTQGSKSQFLVVCPTSVIYHWQDKLRQFLPQLRVLSLHGPNRQLDPFDRSYDLLLTTYGIARNDQNLLAQIPFEIAIFDEVQVAKNPSSRAHIALTRIKAQMRIGLTGTPIENHLGELKALFDLILPGYLPPSSQYRARFTRPAQEHDNSSRLLLQRLIRPFTLRRRKEDVLQELPEKTEELFHCELLPDQRSLYTDLILNRSLPLIDTLRDSSAPIPYLHIFALLNHLKQICDHPAVFLKDVEHYTQYSSGKWELFKELLDEARDSRQKVVVFSQYLRMISLIETYLAARQIGFASIKGSTRDRAAQLTRFQNDPHCEVFVGSLRAAGLGIDLTAGSVVIHYDRWWNAARENQATDRVHRIGQTRGVQVFKLVTVNTFEERIDAIIEGKKHLMEEIIGVDDHQVVKLFSREELIQLLDVADIRHPA